MIGGGGVMLEVSGVILAGGMGTRLGGVKKALVEVGGAPVLQRVLDVVAPLVAEAILVDNDQGLAHLGLRIVPDVQTRAGPLTALYSGLAAVTTPLCLVLACDMPFLSRQLLEWLIDQSAEADVVMPLVEGHPEPMHAVYRREPCLAAIERARRQGQQRMTAFLRDVQVREIAEPELRARDRELHSFLNVNTPDDLQRARELAEAMQGPAQPL
jgi:molybdenum cofactor guanylyltransferase